ncbi:MAG: hypothetical protein JSV63_03320 [Candidatus Aenigmatarchaeota archaeon]|nr:MAG: hypothetical protein JSV63_03320 [Candidatus Aenigmarchaeota archaeon]
MPNENYGKKAGLLPVLGLTVTSAILGGFGTHSYYQGKISDMEFDNISARISRKVYNGSRVMDIAAEYLERGDTCNIRDYMWDVLGELSNTSNMEDDEIREELQQRPNEE